MHRVKERAGCAGSCTVVASRVYPSVLATYHLDKLLASACAIKIGSLLPEEVIYFYRVISCDCSIRML